jgi:hypothetical protein
MLRARWVTLRACGATFRCGTPACGVSRAPRSTTAASTTPGAFPLDSNERFRGSTGVSLSTALLCTGRGKKCVVHRDAKLRNGYVCDFGWMIAHAAVSRRPPVSLDTIVARTHMYTHDCEFGICPSFKRHFFVAPCRTQHYDLQHSRRCMYEPFSHSRDCGRLQTKPPSPASVRAGSSLRRRRAPYLVRSRATAARSSPRRGLPRRTGSSGRCTTSPTRPRASASPTARISPPTT